MGKPKDAVMDIRTPRVRIGTEDILAIGAVIVAIIIAIGIVNKAVDAAQGGTIIVALVGAAGVAQVVKARRGKK